MALLAFRNPDLSVTADESRHWAKSSGGGELHADVTVTSGGYNGTNGWTATTVNGYGKKYPRTIQDDVRFAYGVRIKLISLPAAERVVLAAIDANGNMQCCLSIATDGKLKLWRGNMAALLATSLTAVTTATWYKLGLRGDVDHTSGSLEAFLSATSYKPSQDMPTVGITGADTAEQASAAWRGAYFGMSSEWIIGHAYIIDGSGALTDLVSGLYVKTLAPIGNGSYVDWTPSGATTNWEAVDESDPDDDTTSIQADNTPGDKYSLQCAALATTTRAIYGVQASAMVRNIASSGISASHSLLAALDGSVDIDAWQSCVDSEWRVLTHLWQVNPTTGVRFTPSEINAGRWGGQLRG